MKVEELIEALQKFPKDLEVFTKKTDICGNIGWSYSIKEDTYGFLGREYPCVIISDELSDDEDSDNGQID